MICEFALLSLGSNWDWRRIYFGCQNLQNCTTGVVPGGLWVSARR